MLNISDFGTILKFKQKKNKTDIAEHKDFFYKRLNAKNVGWGSVTSCTWVVWQWSLLCSPALRPLFPSNLSWSSYLLVVLHIVAQTDQTGLELLGHQGPAVVLRSAKHPMTERHIMKMNQSWCRDGSGWPWESTGCKKKMRVWRMEGQRHSWMFRQCKKYTIQQVNTMDAWRPNLHASITS